ncbi:MAG: 16S rRNA (guanine(527)-N(7))-methyltransferase RsmG, partial [Pseudomonadota bacterium]|nr:16S rRNA (guanine(527)-N(7))-methyltransferase RsmG [Pseudomonadota bacterium]
MDEQAARRRLEADFNVSRETMDCLDQFAGFLKDENQRQNLVSAASLDELWSRHFLDSVQLIRFAPTSETSWLDLGSGAGFPGLIVALMHNGHITLVEERRKRADFLLRAAALLGVVDKVTITHAGIERVESRPFDVISARAFAPLDRLFALSHSFSTVKTRFILPKGRSARSELEAAMASWQGDFRLEPSLTDSDAHIIVGEG